MEYIIDYYNSFVWFKTLILLPLMLYVIILYVSGGSSSLKSIPNDRFFSMAIFILLWELLPEIYSFLECNCVIGPKKRDIDIISLYSSHIIHTFIIAHYNPSARIIDLVSHTTYVVYLKFFTRVAAHKLHKLLTPNNSFLFFFFFFFVEKLSMAIFILL